jgi:GH24 family phage-related lysozyme (muramidase)
VKTSKDGINLIKSFEGLRLKPYHCSAGVLTIGYGSTGPHVKADMSITESEADALLAKDLQRFEQGVDELIKVPLTQGEFDALVSFAFNLGCGALEESTLRRRLNGGENKAAIFREELPKWVKGGGGVLPGLVRRREAEVKLATSGAPAAVTVSIKALRATLLKKQPVGGDQLAADQKVAVESGKSYPGCNVIKDEAGHKLLALPYGLGEWWVYSPHWDGLAAKAVAAPSATGAVDLAVPFWPQTDNYTQANRTCNSSSCAMVLEYFIPEAVVDDDQYLRKLINGGYGDTTDHGAQGRLLADYGLKSTWHTNLSLATLEKEIRAGRPVVCGILHRGTLAAPTGGHMIVVRGITSSGDFRVNDPYGSCNDGYKGAVTNGNNAIYSRKLMAARWTPEGPNSGWGRTFQPDSKS